MTLLVICIERKMLGYQCFTNFVILGTWAKYMKGDNANEFMTVTFPFNDNFLHDHKKSRLLSVAILSL